MELSVTPIAINRTMMRQTANNMGVLCCVRWGALAAPQAYQDTKHNTDEISYMIML